MCFESLAWRDVFLNATMLLGGMGPVEAPQTDGGKVFAGLYALCAGLVFRRWCAQFLANCNQKFQRGQLRIQNQCDIDFRRQAKIVLVRDMPDPSSGQEYERLSAAMIRRYVARTDGHAFELDSKA